MAWPTDGSPDWDDLGTHFAYLHQACSSSIVASWEVLAAELHRALLQRGDVDANAVIARLSDALVPTLDPVQDAERTTRTGWPDAVADARSSNRLAVAFGPATGRLARLATELPEGWQKTVDYLGPVYETLDAPHLHDQLASLGRRLGACIADREVLLRAGLASAILEPQPYEAVLAALDEQRMGLQEDIELALGKASDLVLAAARR